MTRTYAFSQAFAFVFGVAGMFAAGAALSRLSAPTPAPVISSDAFSLNFDFRVNVQSAVSRSRGCRARLLCGSGAGVR